VHAQDAFHSHFVAKTLRPFLDQHCIGCHGAQIKKGDLDLEKLSADLSEAKNFEAWVKVHDKVRSGEMPPGLKRRPPEKEQDVLLRGLRTELVDADLRRKEKVGRSVLRRLTRREYENTLRDLLDLPGLSVQDLLPEDGRAFGYDKVGRALELSHVQLSKYLEAADTALDLAIATDPTAPQRLNMHVYPFETFKSVRNGTCVVLRDKKPSPNFPIVSDILPPGRELKAIMAKANVSKDSIGIMAHEGMEFRPTFIHTKPYYAGFYKLRISLWSFHWDKGRVLPAKKVESGSLIVKGTGRLLGYFDGPSLESKVHEVLVWLNPGEIIRFNAATLPRGGPGLHPGKAAQYEGPGLAIDWFEMDGPFTEQWPTVSHRRLFGDLPLAQMKADSKVKLPRRPPFRKGISIARDLKINPNKPSPVWSVNSVNPEADAERLLADFLPRAFRRPVPTKEIKRYLELVKSQLKENNSFEVAMRTAYKAALCSTSFLYLEEPAGVLDGWALASRLSYFLWNSMPDRTLLDLAEKGELKDPSALRSQVERMLRDPKGERFVVDFLDQWLELRDFDATNPDRKLYPEFGPLLHDSMLDESRSYFRELINNDLGVRYIISADFAMLNNRMAKHYRLPEVSGSAMRKVPLPPNSHRGGFLTQASILRVTANGTTTSPVKRGAWVMKQILGEPPAPPPADVPAVEPDIRGAITIRDQLSKHRTDKSCAACHAKIDPPGFALESFDVIGGWREKYRSLGEEGEKVHGTRYMLALRVDASGKTADGRSFNDFEEFRKLLLQDERKLARNLACQLAIYATGAPIGFSDRDEIEKMLDRIEPGAYGVRSLIHQVVQSAMFQKK
jgi:hypothetical protein